MMGAASGMASSAGARIASRALLAALAAGAAAAAEPNLSFEALDSGGMPAGWEASGGGDRVAVDEEIAAHGARSLRISGSERGDRVSLRIPPPEVAGNRMRISVRVKTEQLRGSTGLWLRIDGARGRLYIDRMRAEGASGTTDWTRYTFEAPVFPAASELELGVTASGAGTAWFDDVAIDGFDTAALPPPSPPAARYVERALDIIEEHSLMRPSIDWGRFRSGVLAQARGASSPADAHFALRYALGVLGDHHSYLNAPDRAMALELAPVSNARTGRAVVPPDGRRLAGGFAYVSVPGFAGGSHAHQVEFAEHLQGLIRALDEPATCGWIVDLRRNSGGNVWPMLAGIGPLIGDGEAAAATQADGRRVSLWYRDGKAGLGEYVQLRVRGEAYRLRSPRTRFAVLLGPRTASSGEVLALAFRGLPDRRSFGAPTLGLTTGTRTFELSDGASLVLAVAATSDRRDRRYDGPIAPDEPAPAGRAGAPLLEQDDVRAALRWLQAECSRTANPSGAPSTSLTSTSSRG